MILDISIQQASYNPCREALRLSHSQFGSTKSNVHLSQRDFVAQTSPKREDAGCSSVVIGGGEKMEPLTGNH